MLVTTFNDGWYSSRMLPCSCCRCLLYGRGASSTAVATCYCSHHHHHHFGWLIIPLFLLFFSWPLLSPCLRQCSHHCSCCCHFGAHSAIIFPPPLLLLVSVVPAIIIGWLLPIWRSFFILLLWSLHIANGAATALTVTIPLRHGVANKTTVATCCCCCCHCHWLIVGFVFLFATVVVAVSPVCPPLLGCCLFCAPPPALQCCWCHCCCCLWLTSPPSPAMADCCFFLHLILIHHCGCCTHLPMLPTLVFAVLVIARSLYNGIEMPLQCRLLFFVAIILLLVDCTVCFF